MDLNTKAELLNATKENLVTARNDIKDCIDNIGNSPYESLSQYFFDKTLNYYNNGTNIMFPNTPLAMGCELVSRTCTPSE